MPVDAAVAVASSDRTRRPPPTPTPRPVPPERPPPERPPPTTGPLPTCDEVECVLTNYEGACCKRFKKPSPPPTSGEPPETLDKAAVLAGINKVKGKVKVCGEMFAATGRVQVRFTVNGDGRVASADVKETPDPALGACVASAVKSAIFAKSHKGISVSYPFAF